MMNVVSRYVVWVKAGQRQSSEDAGGKIAHSAGALIHEDLVPITKVDLESTITKENPRNNLESGNISENSFVKKLETAHNTLPLHEAARVGNAEKVLELLEQGFDPCVIDERGRTPYRLATEKEVRNTFRRFKALNLDKWDWQTAKVPSSLTKEMEKSHNAKQGDKIGSRVCRLLAIEEEGVFFCIGRDVFSKE
nr:ankyrin repeat and zinc finger domain-containing protein 1-like isoform X1 [Tanacetum cinerariifolium]